MISNSILLVDDDQELLEVYRKIFELKGFLVKTAENGIAALEIMEKHEIAVVVLDIIMPKMDGMEALTQMKKRWPISLKPMEFLVKLLRFPKDSSSLIIQTKLMIQPISIRMR